MFKLFGKSKDDQALMAIGNGQVIDLSEVEDPVFSQKMMGDGYGFRPEDGKFYSPVAGTISMVPETKHGIGISTTDGLELLIHMGIDTVELKGSPFEILVKEGDTVKIGDPIAIMDLNQVEDAGKKTTTMVIITNSDNLKLSAKSSTGTKKVGELAATIVKDWIV